MASGVLWQLTSITKFDFCHRSRRVCFTMVQIRSTAMSFQHRGCSVTREGRLDWVKASRKRPSQDLKVPINVMTSDQFLPDSSHRLSMLPYYGSQVLLFRYRLFVHFHCHINLEVELNSPGSIYALKKALYYAGDDAIAPL